MPFGRLLTAMITPFRADESLDAEGAARLARHLVDSGNEGIVVSGTTGESPTLTHQEKLRLFRVVKEAVGESAAVIAGTGTYSTRESVELTREAEAAGVDGVMAVVPYYNNPPQEGLYRHFSAIAAATSLPVILYNIPARSPRNLEAATTLRLARHPNVVAVKEASGRLEQVAEIIAGAPAHFRVYSGDDSATLPLMSMGAYGVISVVGHVAGREIRRMLDSFVQGNPAEAAALHARLLPLFQACFRSTNPIPIKAALALLGLPAGPVRLPLVPADEPVVAELRRELTRLGLL
jgi:4-hydroxy-tetrahydrodipicolinate synthase